MIETELLNPKAELPQEQLWGNALSGFDAFIPPDQLIDLSESPALKQSHWQPDYRPSNYNRERQLQKLIDVAHLLKQRGDVSSGVIDKELAESVDRTNKTFDLYEGKQAPDFEGSFAFMVPTRIDRHSSEYGDEILPYLTILRHVDNATRQLALAGTCPWILDIYHPDGQGKQGAMIFAPVFHDLEKDAPNRLQALETTFDIISDSARFARDKLGASVVGLGATFPLLTHMSAKILGKDINDLPGLTVTTGHGGTVWLINETINRARSELSLADSDQIGIIGTGGIGRSAADYILKSDPSAAVNLYDNNQERLRKVALELDEKYDHRRVQTAGSIRELLDKKGIVVSAVTSPITFLGQEYEGLNLEGSFILDDSQPHAVAREEVEARGGKVGWVIGKDGTPTQALTFVNGFNYGGWGPVASNEVWGCQAEAGVIYLQDAPEVAIKEAVTPETARKIGELCELSEIGPAPLQSFGKYI